MSTTMKATIHLGPNYVENLEVYWNTNFEELQNKIRYHTEVDIGPSSGDSECDTDRLDSSLMGEIYTFEQSGD